MQEITSIDLAQERLSLIEKLFPSIKDIDEKPRFGSSIIVVDRKVLIDEYNRCKDILENERLLMESCITYTE
jgi:hypothetical protein